MRQSFRSHDKLFRFGGEEFVVVLRAATEAEVHRALERFRRAVEDYNFPQIGRVTASIGYTMIKPEDTIPEIVGRADDVIKSAGHLIGPFEVESVLMEHPAVVEAGVIGKPDPLLGEVVKAFVALRPGFEAGEALMRELMAHARKRLGAAVAPKEIDFVDSLPHTRSGKIMRRLLKARELGLPEGDISTVESPAGVKS